MSTITGQLSPPRRVKKESMEKKFEPVLIAIERLVTRHPTLVPQIKKILTNSQTENAKRVPTLGGSNDEISSSAEIFTKIYADGVWGAPSRAGDSFFSGRGSHEKNIVYPYIAAIRAFLSSFDAAPSVLDVGCGHFNIGSKLRSLFSTYIACDIVERLITDNKKKYHHLDVDFMLLDCVECKIPKVDIVLARQVLQHLSNIQIAKFIRNLEKSCRYLIITEHLPQGQFVPNHDKATGPGIRLDDNSGVVLTAPPFNLQPSSEWRLCATPIGNSMIETIVYEL